MKSILYSFFFYIKYKPSTRIGLCYKVHNHSRWFLLIKGGEVNYKQAKKVKQADMYFNNLLQLLEINFDPPVISTTPIVFSRIFLYVLVLHFKDFQNTFNSFFLFIHSLFQFLFVDICWHSGGEAETLTPQPQNAL